MKQMLEKYIQLQDKLLKKISFKTNLLMQILQEEIYDMSKPDSFDGIISFDLSSPYDSLSKYLLNTYVYKSIDEYIKTNWKVTNYYIDIDSHPIGMNDLYAKVTVKITINQ